MKYGKLYVIKILPNKPYVKKRCLCLCECGKLVTPAFTEVKHGHTKSCGCYGKKARRKSITKHGLSKTTEYLIWKGMKARCLNLNDKRFNRYGGRGIKICKQWLNNPTQFIKDMGLRPDKYHSLERIDNNKGYEPSNCKWATPLEQANNTSTNKYLTYKNKTQSMKLWCEELNLSYRTIKQRITKLNWSTEKAFETPAREYSK